MNSYLFDKLLCQFYPRRFPSRGVFLGSLPRSDLMPNRDVALSLNQCKLCEPSEVSLGGEIVVPSYCRLSSSFSRSISV
jgi:hypothetical protein